MINKVETKISRLTNNRILDILYTSNSWRFGSDFILSKNINKADSGFVLFSFIENNPLQIENLNIYANLILDSISEKTFFKYKKITRFYWNWYNPNSVCTFHNDGLKDNEFSIIYNLHDNDGGTEFRINEKIEFVKSEASEALIFPSKIFHRGIAPKKNLNRFSLNVVTEI